MRNCIDDATLQAWFDGELGGDRAAEVSAHANTCGQCSQALRELENENAIVAQALAAEFTGPVPSERLRHRLDAAVAEMQPRTAPRVTVSRWNSIRERFAGLGWPAYALTAATLLIATFLGFAYFKGRRVTPPAVVETTRQTIPGPQTSPSPEKETIAVNPTESITVSRPNVTKRRTGPEEARIAKLMREERRYERTIARLNEAIESKPPMRPALQVEYAHNLALIDNAIANTRDVARKNPKDEQSVQFMLAAYQSKVDLMNQIADARINDR